MKTTAKSLMGATMLVLLLSLAAYSWPGAAAKQEIDVLELKAVPDGHYLVNLVTPERLGQLNIEVKGNTAKCVNSSNPGLKGLEGRFEVIGNGVFTIVLRNPQHTVSQWWLFRKDGSATVREVPDRGEKQSAVPIPDETLTLPK